MTENTDDLIEVRSSHGTLFVNEAGTVVEVRIEQPADKDARFLQQIRQFDLDEYVRTYDESAREFDILDLGFWWRDTTVEGIPILKYEPPDGEWRALIYELLNEDCTNG
jgi:hypothetical protein